MVASAVPPSRNVTVPCGVFEPGAVAVTVAVKVTFEPTFDGLSELTMLVLVAGGWNSKAPMSRRPLMTRLKPAPR